MGWLDTPGNAYGVHVSGDTAYVADGDGGLRVIDVSNPYAPREMGWLNTPGNATGVHVSGSTAYVADWDAGLQVIDVSSSDAPREMGWLDTTGNARGVHVSGSTAYRRARWGGWTLPVMPTASMSAATRPTLRTGMVAC
ncbi:hypothetical protein DCC79_11765 [bacterium]|nr:MAG: hypothetical protein DCC79_11765 [bacterium]